MLDFPFAPVYMGAGGQGRGVAAEGARFEK